MARGRKRGCPMNIRNWLIQVLDRATEEWVRIYGLTSMTRTVSGQTSDGSAESDIWEEPYITKRSASLKMEGDVVEDERTGERDAGQQLLEEAALLSGCENDVSLRMVDPYGHSMVADFVVTGCEHSHDDTRTRVSWDLEQVGEAEQEVYVQVQGVEIREGNTAVETLTFREGDAPRILRVEFLPENASNRRFRIYNSSPSVARILDLTEEGFTLQPLAQGSTVIRVESMNQGKSCALSVAVEA